MKRSTLVGLLAVGLSFNLNAALLNNEAPAAKDDIEIVSVKGQRSLQYYVREYERAKFAMYEAYNDINTERQFSIDCRIVKPIGTQIAKRECLPRFYREESAYQTQMFWLGASGFLPANDGDIDFLTKDKQKAFYQHIENLSKDSPELLAHLQNISNKLEAVLVRKYGDPTISE